MSSNAGQGNVDELVEINPEWLNAPPIGICNRCQRHTWSAVEIDAEDRMTQPDGNPCGGRIVATGNRMPDKFVNT